jgi:hypothetical protein
VKPAEVVGAELSNMLAADPLFGEVFIVSPTEVRVLMKALVW